MRALLLSVLGALALTACAGGGGRGDPRTDHQPVRALLSADALMYATFDSDGDVSISQQEVEAGVTREFARADANRDGSLQPIEFTNWSNLVLGGAQSAPYRLDFDRNVDNTITAEEFATEIRARATTYDENGDHMLVRSEFVRLINQIRAPSDQQPGVVRQRVMRPPGQ